MEPVKREEESERGERRGKQQVLQEKQREEVDELQGKQEEGEGEVQPTADGGMASNSAEERKFNADMNMYDGEWRKDKRHG